MAAQRINLYDNMKAFAIVLVVMGHINEFSLGGYNPIWYHFYDSFHMSVFFLVSGLFLFKRFSFTENIRQIGMKLCSQYFRRFLQLMLPFVIVGMLYGYVSSGSPMAIFEGQELRFWFLPSLAIDILIVYCGYFFFRLFKVRNTAVRIVLAAMIWFGCYTLTILFSELKESHYYMMAIRNLPYLALGILYYNKPKLKTFLVNECVLATCFITFFLFLLFGKNWLQIKWGGHNGNSNLNTHFYSI